MIKLDNRDLQILAILQTEGRIAKTELAARVNLSPTPCWERLKRLEQAGVILGYRAEVALAQLGPHAIIFMQAEIGSHRSQDFERFEQAIATVAEITECWALGGGLDYLLKFVCRDVNAYQRLVDELLEADIGLRRYYTYIVTKPVKNRPPALQHIAGSDGG